MKVTQITIGRFHHFHLARQMERFEILDKIYTGYPKFKLKNEHGIPKEKIKTFPWIHTVYLGRGKVGLQSNIWLKRQLTMLDVLSLDKYVASQLSKPTVLVSLSGPGLKSGMKNKEMGGKYICDRGSSHIRFQDNILREEYDRWNIKYAGVDPRIINRGEKEYSVSDYITVPSKFVYDSFLSQGVPKNKLVKIPYGVNLQRFSKTTEPDKNIFSILWVGQASIRKGFLYALQAFQDLKIKNKKFTVIGSIENHVKERLKAYNLTNVDFKGIVPNAELKDYYSSHHVFLLPSIEEGLAMVQGEALACGCPVIATPNSGSEDLIEDGKEGFILPIRNVNVIREALEKFIDSPHLREEMSENALIKVTSLGGWDNYGENYYNFLNPFLT